MARHRSPNPRRVKVHYSYTVDEIGRNLGVHKNTVRAWMEAGLRTIDRQRPTVVLGSELRRFLDERRAKAKRPSPPGHLYCVKCREPRRPAFDEADYLPATETSGNLRALCPDCGNLMHRRIAETRIGLLFPNVSVTPR